MERLILILFDFGYALIFGILGLVTLLLQMSHEQGMESYKLARKALGSALLTVSAYCIVRLIIPQDHGEYVDFWVLTTINLIISWLTYMTLLFLMESPRYLTKSIRVDGIVPAILMLISGAIGMFIPTWQPIIKILLGVVFSIKCAWMFYSCRKEYANCQKDIENYYGCNAPDIKWIDNLLWVTLCTSIATLISFYLREIHLIYYLLLPVIYAYLVFKIVNFAPKKIDIIRKKNESLLVKPAEKPAPKKPSRDITEKVEPLVNKWVESKGFCKADITIKDVAVDMGTNHSYLSQYINNVLDMTFQQWLNDLRIEESKKILLSNKTMSIEEVGAAVGIPQSYNFSKWFKLRTEMTPFRYRKENSK